MVIVRVVADVPAAISLFEPADAMLQAGRTRHGPRPREGVGIAQVRLEGAVVVDGVGDRDAREIGERAVSEIIVPNLLRGEALSSIPIITPTRAKIGINLSAARRFGVSIPQSAVQEADLVIP